MVAPKGVYMLHSILAVANLLAHYKSWLCYYVQVNSVHLKSNVDSKWTCKYLWVTIYFAVDGTYIDIYNMNIDNMN